MRWIKLSEKTYKKFITSKLYLRCIDEKHYTDSQIIDILLDTAEEYGEI